MCRRTTCNDAGAQSSSPFTPKKWDWGGNAGTAGCRSADAAAPRSADSPFPWLLNHGTKGKLCPPPNPPEPPTRPMPTCCGLSPSGMGPSSGGGCFMSETVTSRKPVSSSSESPAGGGKKKPQPNTKTPQF